MESDPNGSPTFRAGSGVRIQPIARDSCANYAGAVGNEACCCSWFSAVSKRAGQSRIRFSLQDLRLGVEGRQSCYQEVARHIFDFRIKEVRRHGHPFVLANQGAIRIRLGPLIASSNVNSFSSGLI